MLVTLSLKNFALFSDATINFKNGFNILIGETGAGKSLIFDALNFVLGAKGNKINIRHEQDKMSVQAVFSNIGEDLNKLLTDNGIEVEDNLYLSRILTIDGRSEARVNGMIVPVFLLKNIASLLVNVFNQNESIDLLDSKKHLSLLDSYDEEILKQKVIVNKIYEEIKNIEREIQSLGGSKEERERELDLLSYQINEIENAQIKVNEDIDLKSEIEKLTNFERICDNIKNSEQSLDTALEKITSAESLMDFCCRFDSSLDGLKNRLTSSKLELEDILFELKDYSDSVNLDEGNINELMARFDLINSLKKKYGKTIPEVYDYLNSIKERYDNLLFSEEKLKKKDKEKGQLISSYQTEANKLSQMRKQTSLIIEQDVLSELKYLGFNNTTFKIDFISCESEKDFNIKLNGYDDVQFLFSANKGDSLKSLNKIISGGEMNRFMLALKTVFAKHNKVSTLVFDEIDTGISGEVGQKVAEKLAILSKKIQVLCITHLSQTTAMADNYFKVSKKVIDNKTFSYVDEIKGNEIIDYIASMSGSKKTDTTEKFAYELKRNADSFKLSKN